MIKNGDLIKNKLTGLVGIVIDNKVYYDNKSYRMKIYYPAEKVPLYNLIGRSLFSYGGKVCFEEYSLSEEVEKCEINKNKD